MNKIDTLIWAVEQRTDIPGDKPLELKMSALRHIVEVLRAADEIVNRDNNEDETLEAIGDYRKLREPT